MTHQLKEGMVAKCDTHAERILAVKAIHAHGKCAVYGATLRGEELDLYPNITFHNEKVQARMKVGRDEFIPLHEFILRGMGLWDEGPKVKVAGHDAVFSKGSVKIGCTTVTNEEVREVYKHLID